MEHEGHPDLLTMQLMVVVGNQLVISVDAPHPVVVSITFGISIILAKLSPQIRLRFALLTAFTLGFFLTWETVSSCVCIVMTIVTTLLSTHHWIWKLSLLLIQYKELKRLSKIFLYSFGGQPPLALAVSQMATFIALAPERTLDKVKRLSIVATYHLDSFRGSLSSNNNTESMIFLPSTLPVHAAGMK